MQDIQKLIDEMSTAWRTQRSLTQMTLGELIEKLESLPQDAKIQNIGYPHSYRGYYSDLSFELNDGEKTVSELYSIANGALGKTFVGYKGGDFYMDKNTPIWIANYGETGVKIMDIKDGDVYSFITEEDN